LLRIFPLFIFTGPLLMIAVQMWGKGSPDRPWWKPEPLPPPPDNDAESRRPFAPISHVVKALIARTDRRYLAIVLGAALAAATLMPLSLITSNGVDGYKAFVFNTRKHKETPLTNHMGLRTVVTYSPSEAGRSLQNGHDEDPWGVWKRAKVATFKRRVPLYLLFVAGFVAMLFAALRNNTDPWITCAMGSMMIPVGIELTCYYYSFLFATTFLYSKRKEAGAIMLGVTAATGFIDWAPTKYLPTTGPFANFRMSQWLDEQYMMMSVVTLVGFVWIMYEFAMKPSLPDPVEAPVKAPPRSPSSANRGKSSSGRGGNRRRR
jgi:hypothetical protein